MTTKLDEPTRHQPSFVLLEEEGGPSVEAAPAPQPLASSPEAAATAAAPSATATASATRPAVELPIIAPEAYSPPELGGVHALSEVAQTELDVATGKALAVDAKEKPTGISKVKLGVTAAAVVVALAIGLKMFGPSNAPAPAPIAQPTTQALPTPPGVAQPGAPTAGTGVAAPAAPTVGIDIGPTKGIELETGGDIDMIEQWTPVSPAAQSCTAQVLSTYLQTVCKKVGQARYFQCAPDGFHWDYRIAGCAQL